MQNPLFRTVSVVFVAVLGLFAAGAGEPLAAQVSAAQARQLLENSSPEQIVERLRASGLSREEVRGRLRRAGYDPALADPYFDALERDGELPEPGQEEELLDALSDVGISLREVEPLSAFGRVDTIQTGAPDMDLRDIFGDSVLGVEGEEIEGLQLFGRELFRRRTRQFSALQNGAVGTDYRLGPGDQLLLVLTGDVERAYTLDVNRAGMIVIPDVGEVSVVGRTLDQLEDVLYDRLGARYSTLTRDPDATTRFNVSLGELRTIAVFVGGEVEEPGRYPVSSVATLLEALYEAGGPTEIGSLRRVRIDRGGQSIGEFDLYPYLVRGSGAQDIRLEQGDLVFVPPAEKLIKMTGAARREAIYELLPGERVSDLVQFAGGLDPAADLRRAEVQRILPPSERTAGVDRVVVDLPLDAALAGMESFELFAGDSIHVFETLSTVRNSVSIQGAVWRPGTYQMGGGLTLEDLIERAGGTPPDVLDAVVHVSRLDQTNGRRSLLRTNLSNAPAVDLVEFDEVTPFGRDSLLVADSVAVFGFVQEPGWYPLAEGMDAEDLILLAGGFRRGAIPWQAEIVEPVRSPNVRGVLIESIDVGLSPTIPYPDSALVWPEVAGVGLPSASEVPLGAEYEVYVRSLPQYDAPRRVEVRGEVSRPGIYVLETPTETLSSIIARAGGTSDEAFVPGARLERGGVPVGVDFDAALQMPGGDADPTLFDGDRIVVPVYDPTVTVRGAVPFETRVQYQTGMSLDDVIAQAGGYASDADQDRVSVTYPNGRRAIVRKRLWIFASKPDIRPGSEVVVPVKEEGEGFDWESALSQTLAVLSTFATVYLAVGR